MKLEFDNAQEDWAVRGACSGSKLHVYLYLFADIRTYVCMKYTCICICKYVHVHLKHVSIYIHSNSWQHF